MKRVFFVLWLLSCIAGTGWAQSAQYATVSGFVYDAANGEALIGANVYLEGTQMGSSSNISGYYVIPRVPVGTYTLVFHYIGYKPQKKEIRLSTGDQKTVTVSLAVKNIEMERVIITEDAIPEAEKLFEKQISNLKLSARQIRQIPQVAEADLLRALQTLPGILPVSDFSSALYVRGGTPDQNLNLLDGTDVYNPEHAFGLFSTFNTDAIKQVELSKGGFSAKYGGRLSSILNVTNLDGNREEFEASGSISLLSAKMTIQMPLGKSGSLSGSFRRTYFDKTIAKAIDDVPNYYFYDGNIKAFIDIDARNKLTISSYGSEDKLDLIFNNNVDNGIGFRYDWGNRTGSARWTHIFSPTLFANLWVTGSRFDSNFDFSDVFDLVEKNFVSDISFKGDFEYHVSKQFVTGFGFEQKNLHLIFRQDAPSGKIKVNTRQKHYAAYVLTNWRPTYRLDVEAGLRYNFFDSDQNYSNFAPRLSAKFRLTDSINLKASSGIYYQYLHRIPRAFIADIWVASNELQKESSSKHLIFGISKDVSSDFQVELEAYYKDYRNIYSYNQNISVDVTPDEYEGNLPVYTNSEGVFNRGDGNSLGVELLLRKEYGALTGWLGYSLSSTEYTIDRVNQKNAFNPRHDRTHAVNLVANLDVKNMFRGWHGKKSIQHTSNWQLGATFVYASGQPITLPGSGYFIDTLPDWDFENYRVYPSAINELRLPAYARLDLSLTYQRHFKSWSIFPYVQIFNIGNRKNIWFVNYDTDKQENGFDPDIDTTGMFPLLPTVGISFQF